MTVDELVRRLVVAVLAPTLGQHVLFVRLHHRELPDFPKITGEAGFGRRAPIRSRQPTHDLHPLVSNFLVSKQNYRHLALLSI
jgi:hypothetical protein